MAGEEPSQADGIHVFWHDGMLLHDAGRGVFDTGVDPGFIDVLENHPENADRVRNMLSILRRGPISPFISWHPGRPASLSELLSFHSQDYINELEQADRAGGKELCPGTFLNPGSWGAALLAAGTTLSAMKHVLDGHAKIAYALVRPPGHHAQPTQADGYCFLNNAGLSVHLALGKACKKVAVIDIDVHYGNGTAEGFYGSDKVLTVSLHMNHGSWGSSNPQSGAIDELGEGEGKGYNLNVPLPNGSGDRGYQYSMEELVVPAVNKFGPDMIVFVVGQDSSAFDPNGRQCLTMNGYREIARIVRGLADAHCGGRLLIVQEGGYHLTYSAYCLHASLEDLKIELRCQLGFLEVCPLPVIVTQKKESSDVYGSSSSTSDNDSHTISAYQTPSLSNDSEDVASSAEKRMKSNNSRNALALALVINKDKKRKRSSPSLTLERRCSPRFSTREPSTPLKKKHKQKSIAHRTSSMKAKKTDKA